MKTLNRIKKILFITTCSYFKPIKRKAVVRSECLAMLGTFGWSSQGFFFL